jgi:uncharacterized DUF497 family protein
VTPPKPEKIYLRVHKIDFADAVGVFYDERAISVEDISAEGEQRFQAIGMDFQLRLLFVSYTYRSDKIRLISARKANKREAKDYA